MTRTFSIDCFATNPSVPDAETAVVAVDVIRASTTVTTALYLGREIHVASSADDAFLIGKELQSPLYAGELGGHVPYGFDLTNSPVQIMALANTPAGFFTNARRPIVLVSSSGIPLVVRAAGCAGVYMACLRNASAVAAFVAAHHPRVALIGAGTRGEFREEDQMGCAWVGQRLVARGYQPADETTAGMVERWADEDVETLRGGNSAEYLRRSGQVHDLEFILHHLDDVDVVPRLSGRRLDDSASRVSTA